jgi:osmotically-inducible protein OsmY
VEDALGWEPSLNATWVVVSVEGGVVTLRGNVGSFAEKVTAERVALHVFGVKALANDLEVHVAQPHERADTKLAQAAVATLEWSSLVPPNKVAIVVNNGWITLSGTVDWQYQKAAAARALRDLRGVTGITNDIVVRSSVTAEDTRARIEAALKRNAMLDARRIAVSTRDRAVVLSGSVRSWTERQEAERAAWAAPGVERVDDLLTVVP